MIKKHMVDCFCKQSTMCKLSLLSPILADGSSHTWISVVRFQVSSPWLEVSEKNKFILRDNFF